MPGASPVQRVGRVQVTNARTHQYAMSGARLFRSKTSSQTPLMRAGSGLQQRTCVLHASMTLEAPPSGPVEPRREPHC